MGSTYQKGHIPLLLLVLELRNVKTTYEKSCSCESFASVEFDLWPLLQGSVGSSYWKGLGLWTHIHGQPPFYPVGDVVSQGSHRCRIGLLIYDTWRYQYETLFTWADCMLWLIVKHPTRDSCLYTGEIYTKGATGYTSSYFFYCL